jgi:hypothetical protein
MRDDLKYSGPNGSKGQFKGIALLPTISGNGRKYVEEELHRSARTLVGKRVDLNHNQQKIKGNVSWAEFEDGRVEYVMEIHDKEYVEKLRDRERIAKEAYIKKWGRDPIYGVSVEANYRYHNESCRGGRCTIEPHGIIFNALSLVEDPEQPGVQGTSIEEIKETMHHVEQQITEALIKDVVPEELQGSLLTDQMKATKMSKPPKQEESCSSEQDKNESDEEDEAMEKLEFKHKLEKIELKHTQETRRLDETINKTKTELTAKISDVEGNQKTCCSRLGEAQQQLLEQEVFVETLRKMPMSEILKKVEETDKNLKDLLVGKADCKAVAESLQAIKTEKADASEVASLKTVMEMNSKSLLEKVDQAAIKQALSEVTAKIPEVEKTLASVKEVTAKIPALEESLKLTQSEVAKLPNLEETLKPIRESISKLPDINAALMPFKESLDATTKQLIALEAENKTLTEKINTSEKTLTALEHSSKSLTEKLATSEKTLAEFDKKYSTLNTVYEALNKRYEATVKETQTKQLQETLEAKSLKETFEAKEQVWAQEKKDLQDQIDTLKLHIPNNFKAKTEPATAKQEPNFSAPYTYSK